jgi:hypothetical protein
LRKAGFHRIRSVSPKVLYDHNVGLLEFVLHEQKGLVVGSDGESPAPGLLQAVHVTSFASGEVVVIDGRLRLRVIVQEIDTFLCQSPVEPIGSVGLAQDLFFQPSTERMRQMPGTSYFEK